MGGAPARVDGRLGLLEAPQFPPGFDHDRIPVFNTNTAIIALDALDRDFDLPWLYVAKSVDGRTAVQLERLYHQIAWVLDTTFLEVPRSGARGRFFPIKEPDDLERARPALREMLAASVRRLSGTKPARSRHDLVTALGRTVGGWASSGSFCPDAAPAARCRGRCCASGASPLSSGLRRPSASAAAARARGRSDAASSARVAGSRSPVPGPRSSTTRVRGRSCRPGRSAAGATSRRCSRSSSPTSWRARRSTRSSPCPGDRERGSERGHVPAARLAEALGARWQLPVAVAPRPHRGDEPSAGRPPARGARGERPRRLHGGRRRRRRASR